MKEAGFENIVIGSGAAGLAAALRLWKLGEKNTALITENMNAGTSRNTGSDKQTYYKLSLAGAGADSVRAMAEDLFSGGAVDGDTALCEAALSARCFYSLVEMGVPFPCNEFNEYMGYKTDHDQSTRATSAGPYTSKKMTEALEREVRNTGVAICDGFQAIHLLCDDQKIYGVLCLNRKAEKEEEQYLLVWADNVILATGGPSGMYRDSVYPVSQSGSTGMAFSAGAKGKNLTEWQSGMASVSPRWNVSGTYMQALPRFFSVDDSGNEYDFLEEYFEDRAEMLSLIFLKGYQWPFDVKKAFGGSSLIDLLVYRETILRGRHVFLDFRVNPGNRPVPFDRLSREAREYLEKAGALQASPVERLNHMNAPAVAFYADHNVDLYTEPLEIALSVQHNNGGIAADASWETDIHGLFAVGEASGTHGVTRPGGSALNAGQAGALRAAQAIHSRNMEERRTDGEAVKTKLRKEAQSFAGMPEKAAGARHANEIWQQLAADMSAAGGMIRSRETIVNELEKTCDLLDHFTSRTAPPEAEETSLFFRLYDMLTERKVYLSAMLDYCDHGSGSRGSALYTCAEGELPGKDLPELFRCVPDTGAHNDMIQEVFLDENGVCRAEWRKRRPVPEMNDIFETEWRAYRKREHID